MFLCLQRAWESLENAGSASWYYGFFATASPLCTAAAFDFEHAMRFLLENGALVDGIHSLHFGNPLSRAIRHGNIAIVHTLTEFGANINIQCPAGTCSTLLILAATYNSEMVKYLLEEYETDTNILHISGRTIVSRGVDSLDQS